MFDQDGNGFIDVQELKSVFGDVNSFDEETDMSIWEQILEEVDTNHDN